jgi:hypothetical protein
MRKSITKKIANLFLAAIVLLVALFILYSTCNYSYSHRILNTAYSLQRAKESVEWYKNETGKYPENLKSITVYAKQIGVDYYEPYVSTGDIFLFLPEYHLELISSAEGNNSENAELNNDGGFYYNKETGEVKINLTEPIETYLKHYYIGPFKGQIPADWHGTKDRLF